ncbi:MAG TPA: hypothetical protein DD400_05765 [Rhodospirillaceae bacterium]|nr:hypothetical protein [Rhodospirillaceae bacterium]
MLLRTQICLLAISLLYPCGAQAGKMTFDGKLSEKGTWDSNPLMLVQDEKELYGSTTSADLSLKNETPTLELEIKGGISQNLFNQTKFNSTDGYGKTILSKKMQRWNLSLQGNVDYDTTRTNEITTFGQDIGSVRRFNYGAAPKISFDVTEKGKIELEAAYEKTIYDSSSLTNYSIASATPAYTYQLTPEDKAIISIDLRRYEALNSSKTRINSIAPSAGWIFELTPRITGKLLAGTNASQEKTKGTKIEKWKWNNIYTAEIAYYGKQTQTSLAFSREQQPYANGQEAFLTGVKLTGKQEINKALWLNLSASYQHGEASGSTSLKNKLEAGAGISYAVLPELDLAANYKYKSESLHSRASIAEANIGLLKIIWHPTNLIN